MKLDFNNYKYYENRELSWLKFNQRILFEARDKNIPILERLKFLSITASNLDEFFMVRVASLKDMVNADYKKPDLAGMNPEEQIAAIHEVTKKFVATQYSTYNRSLIPLLNQAGIQVVSTHEELSPRQATYVDQYFEETVYPVLTPLAVDAARPFPLIRNKSLNIAALITQKEKSTRLFKGKNKGLEFATVQVPSVLPRLIPIPTEQGYKESFILLEQIIEKNIDRLFLNYNVQCAFPYRIMRNADLPIDEDDASDLLKEIQKQLKRRQWGEVIRLEVEEHMDPSLLSTLRHNLNVSKEAIYEISGPIDLTFLMKLYGISGFDAHRYPTYVPQLNPRIAPGDNIFECISKGDIFLHHPYETFDPVVEFIAQAAKDPGVLAIKQTLYRVSGNSPIIAALA
ncbi:MAG: polyphosphate kinase, partial [Lachnospiraceae bacterium]|nr:polyphosphate kinase [Lachnospiraceae bacterium]